MRTFSLYEHFVPLNLPSSFSSSARGENLLQDFLKRNFLAGVLIRECIEGIESNYKEIRSKALKLFKDTLSKLEFDSRYQDPDMKTRIFNIFFPWIIMVFDYLC